MLEERKRRYSAIILGCVWMGMVGVLSFLPNQDKLLLHTTGHFHRGGHLFAFATMTFLLLLTTTSTRFRFLLAALAVFFGFVLEFTEHLVYDNPLERADVLADTFGVILGLLVVLLWDQVNRRRRFE